MKSNRSCIGVKISNTFIWLKGVLFYFLTLSSLKVLLVYYEVLLLFLFFNWKFGLHTYEATLLTESLTLFYIQLFSMHMPAVLIVNC